MTLSSDDDTGYDLVCPECRGNVPADEMVCPSCGYDLRNPKRPTIAAAPQAPSAGPIEVAPGLAAFYESRRTTTDGLYGMEAAGFWVRLVALLIDSFLLGFVSALVFFVALVAGRGGPIFIVLVAVMVVALFLYEPILNASEARGTLGKQAVGLAVVDLSGNRISFGRSLGRSFARILSGLPFYLGYLLALVRSDRRTLHDLIAGTVVIEKL